jgi:peptidoglycan hydrolase-like protein with peptidoglycan-binding domain
MLGLLFVSPAQAQYSTPTYSSACPTLSYNLYRGVSDYYTQGQVSALQQFLNSRYGNQLVTGYFGSMTAANVARFQQEQGVYPVTGGVGPLTRAAIARVCGGITPPPTSNVFYLNTPFTIGAGQTMKQYQGQLDFTLTRINTSPYTIYTYPGYQPATSVTITLGQSCPQGSYCAYLWYPTQSFDLTVGQSITWQGYTIRLNSIGQNSANVTVTATVTPQPAAVTVTSPTQGQTVTHGQVIPISWTVQQVPANSAAVVDLYTVSGSKVGTIAIQTAASSGSINWTVPTPNTVCTLQYPNGLCGQSLGGQYFVKVSIVAGSGFDSNATTYASGNSGTFTVSSGSQQSTTLSASPSSGVAPLMVTFTVTAPAGNYTLDFGDNTEASVSVPQIYCITTPCNPPPQQITHTYSAAGNYTAKLLGWSCQQGYYCAAVMQTLASTVVTVTAPTTTATTGTVSGKVTLSPTCGAEQVGQACTAPYQTTIDIKQSGVIVRTITSNSNGNFSVALAPGIYVLKARGGTVYPTCPGKTVTVVAGQTVTANIGCDTGIR